MWQGQQSNVEKILAGTVPYTWPWDRSMRVCHKCATYSAHASNVYVAHSHWTVPWPRVWERPSQDFLWNVFSLPRGMHPLATVHCTGCIQDFLKEAWHVSIGSKIVHPNIVFGQIYPLMDTCDTIFGQLISVRLLKRAWTQLDILHPKFLMNGSIPCSMDNSFDCFSFPFGIHPFGRWIGFVK